LKIFIFAADTTLELCTLF